MSANKDQGRKSDGGNIRNKRRSSIAEKEQRTLNVAKNSHCEEQFLSSVLQPLSATLGPIGSIGSPLVVVDKDLLVLHASTYVFRLFKFESLKIGESLANIDTLIPAPDLCERVSACIHERKILTRQLDGDVLCYLEHISPHLDENGEVQGAVLLYVDNTEERLAQIKENEKRFNLAVNGASCGIWEWDIASNKVYWSPALLDIMNLKSKKAVYGFKFFESRIHPDDLDDVKDILEAHLQRGFDFNVEFRLKKERVGYVWVDMRGQAEWNDAGKAVRMAGTIYDVTERKRALEQLTRTNESLEKFAYVCSHDLKEPARIVENFVELLIEKYADSLDETAQSYLEHIKTSASRMQEMIEGILHYSQLHSKQVEVSQVNVEKELKDVLENLELSIEEVGASVTYDRLPTIEADQMQIFQLLQNLIGNSLKFCKGEKPAIHVTAEEKDDVWEFLVKDNGIGMEQKHADKVFGVFHRLHHEGKYPGTGVGLSICQEIVKKHGGKIWVKSSLGQGAEFYFTIPKRQRERSGGRVFNITRRVS